MPNYYDQTLSAIVTANHQAAVVFEKYDLDFCCKGKRSLQQACNEKAIPVENVVAELEQTENSVDVVQDALYTAMTAEQLAGYIVLKHHFYVKQAIPVIEQHLLKVATKHGDRFPYMQTVYSLFNTVGKEMVSHMAKEELVLFPRIREVEKAVAEQAALAFPGADYISAPVSVMEMEHDQAGELMAQIRDLTSHYTPPEDACTTFRVVLAALKAFEEDLHRHVHLENNVLFPKAEGLTEQLKNKQLLV